MRIVGSGMASLHSFRFRLNAARRHLRQ